LPRWLCLLRVRLLSAVVSLPSALLRWFGRLRVAVWLPAFAAFLRLPVRLVTAVYAANIIPRWLRFGFSVDCSFPVRALPLRWIRVQVAGFAVRCWLLRSLRSFFAMVAAFDCRLRYVCVALALHWFPRCGSRYAVIRATALSLLRSCHLFTPICLPVLLHVFVARYVTFLPRTFALFVPPRLGCVVRLRVPVVSFLRLLLLLLIVVGVCCVIVTVCAFLAHTTRCLVRLFARLVAP